MEAAVLLTAALRFELGKPGHMGAPNYMEQVYARSIALFEEIFQPEDTVLFVIYAYPHPNQRKRTTVFRKYVKQLLHRFPFEAKKLVYEEEWMIDRFMLTCRLSDLYHRPLLRALFHIDMGLRPVVEQECYFIHPVIHDWLLHYDRHAMDSLFKKNS